MIRLAVCLVVLAAPAFAQPQQCGPYDAVVDGLSKGWQEERQSSGNTGAGRFELFANVNTGSWSLIAILNGIACLEASGDGYKGTPTVPGSDT
jgi:hypothetical protein